MHVFRIMLRDKNPQGGNNYVDLSSTPETSLIQFARAVKIEGGVCNEGVAIPYENILFVQRLDVPDPTGINAPAAGSA